MPDCYCKGNNPSCTRCFGRGYYNKEDVESQDKGIGYTRHHQESDMVMLDDDLLNKDIEKSIKVIDKFSYQQCTLLVKVSLLKRNLKSELTKKVLNEVFKLEDIKQSEKRKIQHWLNLYSKKQDQPTITYKNFLSKVDLRSLAMSKLRQLQAKSISYQRRGYGI